LQRIERAPTALELFAHGAHDAPGTFEATCGNGIDTEFIQTTIARTRWAATGAFVAVKTRASHPPLIGRGLRTKLLSLLHCCADANLRS
jgi:hypothetical protein